MMPAWLQITQLILTAAPQELALISAIIQSLQALHVSTPVPTNQAPIGVVTTK